VDETLKAFANPSWWLLTVVVGLLLNIGAPFINRGIDSWWTSRSAKRKVQVEKEAARNAKKVSDLVGRPTGLLESKMEVVYWSTRMVLVLSVYLLLVQVAAAFPFYFANLLTIPIALAGFFHISDFRRKWNRARDVHNQLLEELRTTSTSEA